MSGRHRTTIHHNHRSNRDRRRSGGGYYSYNDDEEDNRYYNSSRRGSRYRSRSYHNGTSRRRGTGGGERRRYRSRKRYDRDERGMGKRRWRRRSRSRERKRSPLRRQQQQHRRKRTPSPYSDSDESVDDSIGHLAKDKPGTKLGSGRYEIVKQCGLGTFGKVFTCIDTRTRERVAVKVIRGIRRYAKSAKIEASIIQKVNNRDKDNTSLNVRLLSIFTEKSYFESDHVCLVFEQLDISIYDFMKQNQFRGFLYESIRDIARQMLHAVAFLHDMKLTHTDLKPENVLLVDASYDTRDDFTKPQQPYKALRSAKIKLIDFGGATFQDQHKSSIIQTRQYRAPEVILGYPKWNESADVWSVACIVMETFLGDPMFATHDSDEHLALMIRVLGPIPRKMRSRSCCSEYFRDKSHDYELRFSSSRSKASYSSRKYVDNALSLKKMVSTHANVWCEKNDKTWLDQKIQDQFVIFLKNMLAFDPSIRFTARESISCEFLN